MILFHASPCGELHKEGLKSGSKTTCCRYEDSFVYLADLNYLENQYFQYCPKGVYYIFEVDADGLNLEHLEKVNHYRHRGSIESDRISPYGVKVVK